MKTHLYKTFEGEGFILSHKISEDNGPENYPIHIHNNWELVFFLKGNVSYHVEGRSYNLRRGDLVLSRPSVFHSIHPEDESAYERYTVIFDKELLPKDVESRLPLGVDVFAFGDKGRIFEIFERCELYISSFEKATAERLVCHLIEEIFCNLAISDDFAREDGGVNPLVGKALDYIHENLTTVKSIDEVCRALYITKSHLHHIFIENIRVSPKKYINSKRLILARQLIRQGTKPTEAAAAAGFEEYATFYRNYKKQFGCTPSQRGELETTALEEVSYDT